MMRANPAHGADRMTPHHVRKDGNIVIQSKPLRASGNNRGAVGGYIGEARKGPTQQSILSGENMI